MKVLITLGPTQEPIDAVRFITNASSGKMGAALADEAIRRGYEVTLISGHVSIQLPENSRIFRVKTAEEMINATLTELESNYDILISTAAIADYTPVERSYEKIKSGRKEILMKLKSTKKLTVEVRKKFPQLFIVAFKAEYGVSDKRLIDRAISKLKGEYLNLVVANDIKDNEFGSDFNEVIVVNKKEKSFHIPRDLKKNIAKKIWDIVDKEKENSKI